MNKFKHITSLVETLRDLVKTSDTDVKVMGEVMTPIELVEEMLDTLPNEVWNNPDLKWLDPCNGIGVFTSVIVKRLMIGLESFEPIIELRYNHIISKMIYVCELQEKNMLSYLKNIDPHVEYWVNWETCSYLDYDIKDFDIIVMNPPYNDSSSTGRGGAGHSLWDRFVIKAIDDLSDGGYLVAVHPSGWRNINGGFKGIQTLIKNREVSYLEFHNAKDGINTFGVDTRYDYYCLRNIPNTKPTIIKCEDGTIQTVDISKLEFIPNSMYDTFNRLIAKGYEERVNVLSNCKYHTQRPHMSKDEHIEYNYPCVYTVPKNGEPKLRFSSTNELGHFGIPKLIWSNGRVKSVGSYIDINGDYGLTEFAYGIVDEPKNLPLIKEVFDSKAFRELMEACLVSDMSINRRVIAEFRKDFWKDETFSI